MIDLAMQMRRRGMAISGFDDFVVLDDFHCVYVRLSSFQRMSRELSTRIHRLSCCNVRSEIYRVFESSDELFGLGSVSEISGLIFDCENTVALVI